jgi:hypothetical protein
MIVGYLGSRSELAHEARLPSILKSKFNVLPRVTNGVEARASAVDHLGRHLEGVGEGEEVP